MCFYTFKASATNERKNKKGSFWAENIDVKVLLCFYTFAGFWIKSKQKEKACVMCECHPWSTCSPYNLFWQACSCYSVTLVWHVLPVCCGGVRPLTLSITIPNCRQGDEECVLNKVTLVWQFIVFQKKPNSSFFRQEKKFKCPPPEKNKFYYCFLYVSPKFWHINNKYH